MIRINEHDPKRIVIDHGNGFTMVYTRELEPGIEPYLLPSQCEQVFYSKVLGKERWSYIVRYDPRGRLVKYNPKDEENVKEEGDVDQEQLDTIDVLDEESNEEFDQNPNDVADDFVLSDDID